METCCVVCQDNVISSEERHALSCGHTFHVECIIEWFRRGDRTCPVCRDLGDTAEDANSVTTLDEVSALDEISVDDDFDRFTTSSSRADVSRLVRPSLRIARESTHVRSRAMRRLRARITKFIKATEEANHAKEQTRLFLHAHSGPLLSGLKRYNTLVRMWNTRERRLRYAALELHLDHSI
jgi:hypothetical protein